ncbi:MAG: hypothetical protein D6788_11825 [Planctomycetota bacterium]|nr:MAG: hypothetical protein D6788_11825 [Planctomycetota bacterium]
MKAHRRHELKENDLAHAIEQIGVYLQENSRRIGLGVLVVVVVAGAVLMGTRSRAAAIERAWRRKAELRFDDFETGKTALATLSALRKEVADDEFVMTALIEEGEQALRLALQAPIPPDPELNARAREAFTLLLERFGDNPVAFGIAHLGLATVEENEFQRDEDPAHKEKARAHLDAVAKDKRLAGMPMAAQAMKRLQRLDDVFTPVELVETPVPEETAEGTEPQTQEPSTQEPPAGNPPAAQQTAGEPPAPQGAAPQPSPSEDHEPKQDPSASSPG